GHLAVEDARWSSGHGVAHLHRLHGPGTRPETLRRSGLAAGTPGCGRRGGTPQRHARGATLLRVGPPGRGENMRALSEYLGHHDPRLHPEDVHALDAVR